MLNKPSKNTAYGLIASAFLVALLALSWWSPHTRNAGFWKMRGIEALQVVTPLLVALYIGYVVEARLSSNVQRRLLLDEGLRLFLTELDSATLAADQYWSGPDKLKQDTVVRAFGSCGRHLQLLQDLERTHTCLALPVDTRNRYIDLRQAAMNDPFGQVGLVADQTRARSVDATAADLRTYVWRTRLKLFDEI